MFTLTFKQKLWLPLICSLLCLAGFAVFEAFQLRATRIEERCAALTGISDVAVSVVGRYAAMSADGKLDKQAAQARAMVALDSLRYGRDGYVALIRSDGMVLQNPGNPASNGKNMIDFRDANGVYIFREFSRIADSAQGTGFLQFLWLRPGQQHPSPKLSRVSVYRPWNWVFVTGIYIDDIDADFHRSLTTSACGLLAAALLLMTVASLMNRSLQRALGGAPEYAVTVARRIAANDLSGQVRLQGHDATSLLHAMHTMQRNLAGTINEIRGGADLIATASSQVTAGNLDLSARTESQASSLEETAASMEQLTAAVRQNAENARQANSLVQSAAETARQGGTAISRVITTMEQIQGSSNRVADIIGVIDGIAFQTNILALNAAVEAARAGEQGRGFAVVAGEVRNLAQRSATAARDVKRLIDESIASVVAGQDLVTHAGHTIQRVVDGIDGVAPIMAAISEASHEQSVGIGHINEAITEMDSITQQNAALVEQAAAAASSMQEQALHLARAVGRFQLAAVGPGVQHRPVLAFQ